MKVNLWNNLCDGYSYNAANFWGYLPEYWYTNLKYKRKWLDITPAKYRLAQEKYCFFIKYESILVENNYSGKWHEKFGPVLFILSPAQFKTGGGLEQ